MKRKTTIKKLLAASLISALALTGCQSTTSGDIGIEPFFGASEDNPLKDLEYVLKIDDYLVSPDEYRYVYENSKAKYTYGMIDSSIETDNEELAKKVKEDALLTLQYNIASLNLAKDKGISLNSADLESVSSAIEYAKSQLGGEENYIASLKQGFLTPELYEYIAKTTVLKDKLYSDLFFGEGEYAMPFEDVKKIANDEYLHAKHVLISVENDDWAAAEKTANEVLEKAKNGENFDNLITEYGQDPGMSQNPDGYYFKEGTMVDEFYEATKALGDNEISGLVKSDFGYHIIQRLPIEDDYIKENSQTFVSDVQFDAFAKLLDSYIEKQNIEYSPEYEGINFETFAVTTENNEEAVASEESGTE